MLVTSGHDGFYRFWDIETHEFLMEIDVRGKIDILSHGFSPDGSVLYYMAETELISTGLSPPAHLVPNGSGSGVGLAIRYCTY